MSENTEKGVYRINGCCLIKPSVTVGFDKKKTAWDITCHAPRPLVIFDGRLNSTKYVYILETYLPTAFQKYPPVQLSKIFYQHDNARLRMSTLTKNFLKRKCFKQIIWPVNSSNMNIIENFWSVTDNKLLKFRINNVDKLINALQTP